MAILARSLFLVLCLMMIQVCLEGRSLPDEIKPEAKKVPLNLYYESLCPGCENFIVQKLAPIFKNGMIDIISLRLVPWGNAILLPNNTFACQHGDAECSLNMVEACAIDTWPTVSENFRFIHCVESQPELWVTCFDKLGLDPKPFTHCIASANGYVLELKYANETKALRPPHQYVPWVLVDGKPIYEDADNFVKHVCKAYKGIAPPACKGISSDSLAADQTSLHSLDVCCADKIA